MPSILTVSRNFPPVGPPGSSIRLIKFIKYLSPEGWNFFIITQDPEKPAVIEKERSAVLESEIPTQTIIRRIPARFTISDKVAINSLLRYLTALFWSVSTILEGLRLIKRNQIDLLYAAVPNIVNGVTIAIVSRISKIPFVLDIKDDIVGGMFFISRSKIQQAIERILEKYIIDSSAQVVFVTEKSLEIYKKRYPFKSKELVYIPNGCDLDEFFLENHEILKKGDNDHFLILTAASRYRRDYRDADPFLKAIALFLCNKPEAKDKIKIVFLGNSLGDEYNSKVMDLGLSGIINCIPTSERNEYRTWLKRADLLFLVQPLNSFSSTSGTLYEYWATANAPILLISEEGSSRELIEKNQIGKWFYYPDTQGIAMFVEEIYQAYISGKPIKINSDGVEAFDRRTIAQKMKKVWLECATQNNHTEIK